MGVNYMENTKFRFLSKNIASIANTYFLACNYISTFGYKQDDEFAFKEYQIIKNIKFVFSLLNSVEQEIINNEFFFQNYPFWWENIYSEKVFKKIKYCAMKNFYNSFRECLSI